MLTFPLKDPYAQPLEELEIYVLPLRIDTPVTFDVGTPLLNQFPFSDEWVLWFQDKLKEVATQCNKDIYKEAYLVSFNDLLYS